jgi:hypothetical protein
MAKKKSNPSSRPPQKRPEREEFFRIFFPELAQSNLKSDKDAYSRLATLSCEAILSDFIKLYDKHYLAFGPGVLIIRLGGGENPPFYLAVDELRKDLETAERHGDSEVITYLKGVIETIEGANIDKCVVLMLSDNSTTRVFRLDREYPAQAIQQGLEQMGS